MSACALNICMNYNDPMMSFDRLHEINKRATPEKMMLCKHALLLHKIYNSSDYSEEWIQLNLNQTLTSRQTDFKVHKTNQIKIGFNAPANRLSVLNGMIPLTWLDIGIESFKIKFKELVLV